MPTTTTSALLTGRFGWFFAGRSVDLFGSSMTTVALSLAVLQVSGQATHLGVVLAANLTPTLALLLLGGVLADRTSRRRLLIAANLVSAAATGAVAVLLLAGRYDLATVAALSLITGAADGFAAPALRGIVPELVADDDLPRANALLASSRNAVRVVAPLAAGLLTATAGGGWAVAVDALSFLAAAALFTRLPRASTPPPAAQPLWRDLADGWRVFTSLPWVVLTSISFALLNAVNVGPWNILGPLLVAEHDGPFGWGAVLSVRAAGLLLASVLAVRLALRHPLRAGRTLGVLAALPLFALGLHASAWTVAAAAFVGALGFTVSGLTWETALQQRVPRAALSRVAAFDDLFSFAAIPLSQLAVGPLVTWLGASRLALLCGLGYVAAALLPLLSREVRAG